MARGNRTFLDITGHRYGRYTVLDRATPPGYHSPTTGQPASTKWRCKCDCGTIKVVGSSQLRNKKSPTLSCGCLGIERRVASVQKHGMYKSSEYRTWECMIQRCCNPKHKHFSRYGGRGIVICDRWRNSFADFLADMGPKPTPNHTIEREDNDAGYCPENCRWASSQEQGKNKANSVLITLNGRTETANTWHKITGIPSKTIYNRFKQGQPPELILRNPRLSIE